MHPFLAVPWVVVVVGNASGVWGRAVPQSSAPVVTAPPTLLSYEESLERRQEGPDAVSLAYVLLTAVPQSIREVAATNIPAASSIINEQFFDGNRPQWFLDLPWDVQVYLVEHFGPGATAPPALPSGLESFFPWPSASPTESAETEVPSPTDETNTESPEATSAGNPTATEQTLSSEPTASVPESSLSPSRTESPSASSQETSTPSQSSNPTVSETGSSKSEPSSSTRPGLAPDAADNTDEGLSRSEKIGIGLGVPLGLAAAAGIFACCILYRRRQRKKREGSIPPSSPGFIPPHAFRDKDVFHTVRDISYPGPGPQDPNEPHQRLLTPNANASRSFTDLHAVNWDEEVGDTSSSGETVPTINNHPNNPYQTSGPVMAPVLPTHSSNRARGRRTSYTSLHSVAEVTEPDDDAATYIAESPILPRNTSPKTLRKTSSTGISPSRCLVIPPAIPENATVKRKPIGAGRTPSPGTGMSAAATMASQSLLHPALRDRSTLPPLHTQNASSLNPNPFDQSPYISPIEDHNALVAHTFSTSPPSSTPPRPQPYPYPQANPNSNPFTYEEDYGPEYSHQHTWHAPVLQTTVSQPANNFSRPALRRTSDPDAYIDMVDGLYGNTSLSRYPDPGTSSSSSGSLLHGHSRKGSKTEWPLRNMSLRGMRRGSRDKGQAQGEPNPLWERVYESP